MVMVKLIMMSFFEAPEPFCGAAIMCVFNGERERRPDTLGDLR
jgi:hypothetical protein